jgi:phage major head subunit gpT-like protein
MANTIRSAGFVRLLEETLTEVADQAKQFAELGAKIPELYNVTTSNSAWEEFFSVGTVPDIPQFTGRITSLAIAPGYYMRVEHKEYAGELQWARTFIDDKKYGVLSVSSAGMMESAVRTKEKLGVRTFSNAFSTAYDFHTSEEGVALCSSSHTNKSGAVTTSGFDNAGTSALSKTSIAATRLLMRRFRNDRGDRIQMSDNIGLIVPDNLEEAAWEVVNTQKGLDSAEGNENFHKNRYTIIPYMRLDDYDTNNWYMVDMNAMKRDLIWYDRVAPEFNSVVDYETFVTRMSIYFRCSYAWKDWRWIYGHNVS